MPCIFVTFYNQRCAAQRAYQTEQGLAGHSFERTANAALRQRDFVMTKLVFTALAALAFAATPAAAQEITASVAVPFADLDLSTDAGVNALESRVSAAAKEVCGEARPRDLKAMAAWQECRAKAEANALAQVAFTSPFAGIELASWF